MIDRGYLTSQAAWLFKFAKSIKDPDLAAVLIEKAADLKAKAEDAEPPPPTDTSPRPPDFIIPW